MTLTDEPDLDMVNINLVELLNHRAKYPDRMSFPSKRGDLIYCFLISLPRLHDTTGCQAGCTAGLTIGCDCTTEQPVVQLI